MSRADNGDMVIGAIPMPAETRDTAKLRCVSNHPVTHAIMGAKMAAAAPPTTKPKDQLKLNKRRCPARQRQTCGQDTRAYQHYRTRIPAVREISPDDACQCHGKKTEGHGARYAGDRPASIPRDRPQKNRGGKTWRLLRRSPRGRRLQLSPNDSEMCSFCAPTHPFQPIVWRGKSQMHG